MTKGRHTSLLNYLRQVLNTAAAPGVSDAELLRRYVAEHDEAAFELLLWRHASMVLHVCRQVLDDVHAAEDAFQATFVVFVQKADSIGRREALGSWLYRVAYNIALKAREKLRCGAADPAELDRVAGRPETDDAAQRELRRIVCEEVDRLPEKYRAPIVACFFEGKTHEEAAQQLGWPRGTVAGRLSRAREVLRRRLTGRGVTFTMSALLAALAVRSAQAARAGLVDSVIHTARLLAAGQAAGAVVSPQVAALTEGVLHVMYWTRTKILVVTLFLAGLGGAGVSLVATQEPNQGAQKSQKVLPPQPSQVPNVALAQAGRPPAAIDEEDEPAEEPIAENTSPEEAAQLARDMARSRLNLKKLAIAMQNYSGVYARLPLAASVGTNGKALLSWRVELLPYPGEQELYQQFKRDEPWNSPHNRKLLSKMPAVFAPPGVKTRIPYSTFYQVFVSAGSASEIAEARPATGGMPGMPGMTGPPMAMRKPVGPPGGRSTRKPPARGVSMMPMQASRAPGMPGAGAPGGMGASMGPNPEVVHADTVFIKGRPTLFPASIPDGTSNTILIVEAGNPVPWTKPEDLHYAEDEALPELGGLFPNVFHAAFADGGVHALTKNYNEKQLRRAITANDGYPIDMTKIEARFQRKPGMAADRATVEAWQRKNEELRRQVELARAQIRLLKEEQEIERELAGEDAHVIQLKDEHAHMQAELKKLRAEIESLKKDTKK